MRKIRSGSLPVTVTLLILTGSPVYPQTGLQVGITAGVQNTLLRSKNRSEIDVQNAFCPLVTADIEYGFSTGFAVQSGVGYALYSQNTSKFRNNFHYLVIPLYLKVGGFREDRKVALNLYGGANYKILISARNVYQGTTEDISDYTNGSHLDYTVGIGLKYRLNENLVLESSITTSFLGGSFNKASFDGFFLRNLNYGVVAGFRYRFTMKQKEN